MRVNELIQFVANSLPPMPVGKRMNKASQYVYTNLMMGKMIEPDGDLLFAQCDFEDKSLKSILVESYNGAFCAKRQMPLIVSDEDPAYPEQLMKLRYQCTGGFHNVSLTRELSRRHKRSRRHKNFLRLYASNRRKTTQR